MEKLIPRENVQVGYGKSPDPEDMDFNDVFGGPPRRFSMQEVRERYSFGNSEEETTSPPWGALKDKPVFGEESTPRRRRKGTDFFNDIFKGGDGDRDSTFGSNPSSRIMSPRADSLGTSLPAASQFSLPAKSTKAMDLPTFGSNNHGQYKVDGGGNGVSSPQSWSALSRFSNEAARGDSHMNEVRPVDGVENQFHFSIYKWAGKGVPMLMPLVIGNNLKSNMKYEKSPSSNERMDSKSASVKKQQGSSVASKEEQVKSVDERSKGERIEIEVPVKISEGLKPEGKPLHAFLVEGDQSGETKVTYDSKKVKEKGKEGVDSKNANSEAIQVKSAAGKGKVKEFVQIFNQEPDVKGSQSSRMGNVGTEQKGFNEVSSNPAKVKEEANLHNAAKKPDVTFKVVEDLNNEEAHTKQGSSPMKTSSHTRMRSSSTLRRSFSAGTIPKDMKMSPENLDDSLEDNFVVQELHDDLETVAQNDSSDETKVIDAKIRQWSVGKKGNIRSLLSTLQYVLWQESGWKPVPLVDLIETSSVKRAYQKALLRLHPDKLQQKGAAFHQKYTAEKVFDILQEAWDHFNSCSSLGI